MSLFATFVDGASPAIRASLQADEAGLQHLLDGALRRARDGAVGVDDEVMARALGAAVGDDAHQVGARLLRIHAADLALATGALAGVPSATQAFHALVRSVRARIQHLDDTGHLDDAVQRVLARLLTAEGNQAPRLRAYHGAGPLAGYVQVALTREALALRPQSLVDDGDAILRIVDSSDDPEVRVLKERYSSELKATFHEVLATLAPKDRLLLRQSLLDGLGVEALAQLYGVHHATAARRLTALRDHIGDQVRTRLRARLLVSEETLQSILRLLRSRIDLSLHTALS
jgi:RNA polymerase sigma-70 factor (ECF subfamily)